MSTKIYMLFSAVIVFITMVGIFVVTSKLQDDQAPRSQRYPTSVAVNKARQQQALPTEHDQSLTILNMWYDLEPSEEIGGVRIDSGIKSSRRIGIHTSLLSAIESGYRLQLPSLVGDNYFLKLGKVEKINDTQIQIYGEIQDHDEMYFSTISIIDNTMLAVLSTPHGDYDLKMVDGKGVVYKLESEAPSKTGSVVDQDGFLN